MGRLKRNKQGTVTIAVSPQFRDMVQREKQFDETTAQKCDKILSVYRMVMANENTGTYWYEQYLKVKKEIFELRKQTQWLLQ